MPCFLKQPVGSFHILKLLYPDLFAVAVGPAPSIGPLKPFGNPSSISCPSVPSIGRLPLHFSHGLYKYTQLKTDLPIDIFINLIHSSNREMLCTMSILDRQIILPIKNSFTAASCHSGEI